MDFEHIHFSYFFKKRTNIYIYINRKVKLSISYKDFHCFEPMGFAHVRFSSNFLFQKTQKNTLTKKTTFQKNLLKPTKYQHFHPPKSSKTNVSFFLGQTKRKAKKKTQKSCKNTPFQKHL